MIVDNS